MYEIKLGREHYHHSREMIDWCEKYIGHGGWNSRYIDKLPVGYKWDVDQTFGYTTFRFEDARDYSKFVVKWDWTNNDRH